MNTNSKSNIQSNVFFNNSQQLNSLKLTNSFDNMNCPHEQNREFQTNLIEQIMKLFNKQSKNDDLNLEALSFMRGIMDECTHLKNFKPPVDLDIVIAVCAKRDGYVPLHNMDKLEDIWPGVKVRYIDTGHVAAFLLHRNTFKTAIIEAFQEARKKYCDKTY